MDYTKEEKEILGNLADSVIEQLKKMKTPIVRVCGPLTTGGFNDYDKNAKRLRLAESILISKGYTVCEFGPAEESIKDKGFSHSAIMDVFHKKVLDSGLIGEAFFLNGWESSKGASMEHALCKATEKIVTVDFPEVWFDEPSQP